MLEEPYKNEQGEVLPWETARREHKVWTLQEMQQWCRDKAEICRQAKEAEKIFKNEPAVPEQLQTASCISK